MRILILCLFIIALSSCERAPKQIAVSSGDKYASEVALEIMKKGGTVIDAFIAANFVLTMTEPGASGIGGGFLGIYYDTAKSQFFSIDARETQASKHQDFKLLKKELDSKNWSDSKAVIGIPGEVAGMALLYQEFGTMPLEDLIDPAIKIAEEGFIASEYFIKAHRKFNVEINSDAGEKVLSPNFAKTLKLLKENGLMSFYNGEIADAIETYTGGWLTKGDMKNYRALFRRPVKYTWKNSQKEKYYFLTVGLPSAGPLIMKQFLKNFKAEEYNKDLLSQLKEYRRAIGPALNWRHEHAADPDFRKFDCKLDPVFRDRGTSHISLYDSYGNILSATMTIQRPFGHQKKLPGYGFYLNNELTDFSKDLSSCNSFADHKIQRLKAKYRTNYEEVGYMHYGEKKPLSSMSPMIIFGPDAEVLVTGGTGGWTIFSSVLETSLEVIDKKLNPEIALDDLRFYTSNNKTIYYDGEIPREQKDEIEKYVKKNNLELKKFPVPAAVSIVHMKDRVLNAYKDDRKGGYALTYTDY
ncbi:MAG: gamma-glutamyltransferase [Candidatus Caenarcaniphilales bacterium]|nr:gamma-glutamyltransferase [Candidatus Caenarcaniphilales bacterium]